MSTESTSPDGGAMTVDQAIEALTPSAPEPAPVEAAAEPDEPQDTPSEADPEAEAPSEPNEANEEGENEAEKDEPAVPVVDPPPFWDADAKTAFAGMTPEQQTIVAAQASKQASEASKAIQTAAEARKAAEGQAAKVNDLATALNDFLPRAVETFKGRWDGIDWPAWAQQDPTAAFQGKLQFDAEQAELQRLTSAKDHSDRLAAEQFVASEYAKLPDVAPELADPKEGKARRAALAAYLVEHGVPQDMLPNVSAVEMSIAYKAMQFDKLKATPPKIQPKTSNPAPKPPARPAAAAPTPTRSTNAATAFAKSQSVENAVALLMSKGR